LGARRTAQVIELMAQHDQLDVLDLRGPATPDQQLQHGHKDEVGDGEEHRAMLPEPARGWRSGRITALAPFTLQVAAVPAIPWMSRMSGPSRAIR
jgi:hypothetical protein